MQGPQGSARRGDPRTNNARYGGTREEGLSNSATVLNQLRSVLRHAVDVLAPQDCFACGASSGGEALCPGCAAELPIPGPACPQCAAPVAQGELCGHCLSAPPAFDATFAAFEYAFPVDRMVQALKYQYRLSMAPFFAGALLRSTLPLDNAILLPMPLHVQRLRERGFNQAVEIARPLARAWRLPMELTAVQRMRNVPPQAGLAWGERLSNMRNVFSARSPLTGLNVIVVDDVMTTGASLQALAAELKRAGAARVMNLVVARTPPRG